MSTGVKVKAPLKLKVASLGQCTYCVYVWGYGGMDRSIYILPYVPLRDQVSSLLDRQLVEEAVLLAETIAALEAAKEKESPEEVSESWSIVVTL